MKILLTGASGFLGSALAKYWHQGGHEIALLLREKSKPDRFCGLLDLFDVGRFSSDLDVYSYVEKIQPDVVVHTAGLYGRLQEKNIEIVDANLRFGLVILQALQRIEKTISFINSSTALAPQVSSYALSKSQFSEWGRVFASNSNGKLRFINVLLQHVFGPGDALSKFTTHVLHACHDNHPVLSLTAGEQVRDFIYIDDVVDAFNALLVHCQRLGAVVDVELGSGKGHSVRKFVETVHRLTNSRTELLFGAIPYRANEAMNCFANIEQITKLGWTPKFDLTSGLEQMIKIEFEK